MTDHVTPVRLLVDADGCPVRDICRDVAKARNIPLLLFCREFTGIRDPYGTVIHAPAGPDSADHALALESRPGDVVITGDFGLAALVIDCTAAVLDFLGNRYNPLTLDGLLLLRHASKKARRSGKRTHGPRARTDQDNEVFRKSLEQALNGHNPF